MTATYQWRGRDNQDELDRARWERLDRRALNLEQINICADTTEQRHRHALEANGISLQFRHPTIDPRHMRRLIDLLADLTATTTLHTAEEAAA